MLIENHLKKLCPQPNKRNEVIELVLDQIKTTELKPSDRKLLEEFSSVYLFSMNDCGLRGLNNFPQFKELEILELNDNKIKGSELNHLQSYKNLTKLRLSNNLISSIEEIKVLKSLDNLAIFDLMDNPITKISNYREEVFKALPSLLVLDNTYKDGEMYYSEEFEDEEGEEFEDEEEDEDFLEDEEDDLEGKELEDEEEDDEIEEEEKPHKKRRVD